MTQGDAGPALRRGWWDPLGAGLAVVAGVVFSLHGFHGLLTRDLSLYTYAGQRFAEGVPPYLGVLNRSGPLSHALPGIGIWLGRLVGADDVIAVRVFFLLLAVLSVYAVYLLGREAFRARWAGVAAGLALVSLGGFLHYATDGPREKTPMVLFLALALLATLRRRWWWAGFWVSIGTLTFQPGFFSAIIGVAAGVLVLEARGRRLRALAAVTVSGLLPLAAFMAWYAVLGELRYFLDCFVMIHVRYTQQPGALTHLSWTWEELDRGYGATRWVLVLGTAAILAAALRVALRPTLRADPRGRSLLVLGIATFGGLAWSVRAFNGWPDAFILVPMAAVGVPALLSLLGVRRDSRRAVLVTAGWAVVALALAVTFALGRRTDDLTRQRVQAAAVEAVLGPDATYLSMEGPAFLVLTDRVNPLRDQMYGLGLTDYIDATRPGGLAGVAEWVEEQRPTLITKGRFTDNAWIQPVLQRDYERCARDRETSWWVSTTAGPQACARIGEIVGTSPS